MVGGGGGGEEDLQGDPGWRATRFEGANFFPYKQFGYFALPTRDRLKHTEHAQTQQSVKTKWWKI